MASQGCAEVIFGNPGIRNSRREERPFVVEQVVEPLHRLRVDEFVRQGRPEERERLEATNDPSGQSEWWRARLPRTVRRGTPQERPSFPRDGAATTWTTCSRMKPANPRRRGVDPDDQALPVHEKWKRPRWYREKLSSEEGEEKHERLDRGISAFLQRTGPGWRWKDDTRNPSAGRSDRVLR